MKTFQPQSKPTSQPGSASAAFAPPRRVYTTPAPVAEAPDIDTQLQQARAHGHSLSKMTTVQAKGLRSSRPDYSPALPVQRKAVAGGGGVVQCEGSEKMDTSSDDLLDFDVANEEDEQDLPSSLPGSRRMKKRPLASSQNLSPDDEEEDDWSPSSVEDDLKADPNFGENTRAKSKSQDPDSEMRSGTYSLENNVRKYQTVGRVEHKEVEDLEKGTSTTISRHLSYRSQYRNNVNRKDAPYKVHNPYNLSKGQRTGNTSAGAHRTPSFFGMRAGGKYGNVDYTSPEYNKETEKHENPLRNLLSKNKKYTYKTETQTEGILDNMEERAKAVAPKLVGHWENKPERVLKRWRKIAEKNPNARRVIKQTRTVTDEGTGKLVGDPIEQGIDLHFGLPSRAFREDARKKYKQTRGQSSEESDNELSEETSNALIKKRPEKQQATKKKKKDLKKKKQKKEQTKRKKK